MTKLSLSIAFTTGLLASSLLVAPASAQALQSRYWLEASAYWPNIDTTVSVTGTFEQAGQPAREALRSFFEMVAVDKSGRPRRIPKAYPAHPHPEKEEA